MGNIMSKNTSFLPATTAVKKTKLAVAIAGSIMASSMPTTAFAQQLEEVIVTATKRAESVQDVPLAITAFSGDFTRNVNLDDVKDLIAFTPGITGNSQDSFIDAVSIRGIRTQDFGIGGDPSAAFFKNDLYEGRNGSAVTSLYDMERSEVLRGPQGFLFGRNSIGGAISVHTKKAQMDEGNSGYVDVDVAEFGRATVEGAVNLPVNDSLAFRVAGYHSEEDGEIENEFNGEEIAVHDKSALRLSSTYETNKLTIDAFAEYEDREQSGSNYRGIEEGDIWEALEAGVGDINLRGGEYGIDSDQTAGSEDNAEILTLGVKVDYDFDNFTLTSNTGYKDHDYFYSEDYDGTPLDLNNYTQDQTGDYFQQELRIASNTEGPLSWYAGASYYEENIDTTFTNSGSEDLMCAYYGNAAYPGYDFGGCIDLYVDYFGYEFSPASDGRLVEQGRIKGEYTGWATYINLAYEITDGLEVEVGARYTSDTKDFSIDVPTPNSDLGNYFAYGFSTDGFINTKEEWTDTQTRALVRYRPNETAMFYASYTEGFKSGGFGSFALNDANNQPIGYGATDDPDNGIEGTDIDVTQAGGFQANAFDPETVDSYEIGYKDTLGSSTDISLTAFAYAYEDLQVVVTTGGCASTVDNIGEADSYGLEGTMTTQLSENFSLYIALSYLDSEANDLQDVCGLADVNGCEGSSLFWAPEWSGAIVLNGTHPINGGEIRSSGELFGESERGGGFEDLDETIIDSTYEMALRVGYHSDNNWGLGLYVENLTDEETWDGTNVNGGPIPSHFFGPNAPRTVGVNFSYEWE
jgi:iron complex outermembrane receptor protein